MKKVFIALTLLASSAWANPDLMGAWKSIDPLYSDDGMQIHADLNFKPKTVVVTSHCTFKGGAKLSASLETKVIYGPKKIKMTENKDNVQTDSKGHECPVFSREADVEYVVTADKTLIMTYTEAGYTVKFRR